MTNVLT